MSTNTVESLVECRSELLVQLADMVRVADDLDTRLYCLSIDAADLLLLGTPLRALRDRSLGPDVLAGAADAVADAVQALRAAFALLTFERRSN
jgi:hypothetical protein